MSCICMEKYRSAASQTVYLGNVNNYYPPYLILVLLDCNPAQLGYSS
jgi:hypothetical protein